MAKQERVDEAVRLITQLLPDHMIIQRVQEKFNVGRDTARLDVISAHETFRRPPQDREARREELLSAYALHYATCMSKGAYVAAGNALRDLAKIEGLMTNTVIVRNPDAPGAVASTDQRDPKALKARLQDLLKKHRATLGQAAMDAQDDPELKPHYQSVNQELAVERYIKGAQEDG